jgi:hypothetical protein
MNIDEMVEVLRDLQFGDYSFSVTESSKGAIYLQAQYPESDIVSGKLEVQHTRKWLLSEHMTKSELVQTAFKCCLASVEHNARETFKYRGKRIFGPHFDVDQLVELCGTKCLDVRKPNTDLYQSLVEAKLRYVKAYDSVTARAHANWYHKICDTCGLCITCSDCSCVKADQCQTSA